VVGTGDSHKILDKPRNIGMLRHHFSYNDNTYGMGNDIDFVRAGVGHNRLHKRSDV
jgi:hypothetical protein